MSLVEFTGPDCSTQTAADVDYVVGLVLTGSAEFWEGGATDAALRYREDGRLVSELMFLVRDPFGVFFIYTCAATRNEFTLTLGGSEDDCVTVAHGGNPWELPKTFFVSREIAADVIREFFNSGKQVLSQKWVAF